ncbi:MAG: exodeoxyribonuclease VII small subunit [Lachnospiraceae bacterium]|nr:exodeoxyribonuclease VII small subunit [Lachnospiraceae bacterium]
MKKEEIEKLSIEESFDSVELTLEKLRSDELPLEESFQLYQDGMQILKSCAAKIDKVEKQVQKLSEDGETVAF